MPRLLFAVGKKSYIFMTFAFSMGSLFLFASSYQKCILFDKVSLYFIILYLLVLKYIDIPYSNLFSKVRWSFPILWVLSAILLNVCLKWDPVFSLSQLEAGWGSTIPKSEPFRHGLFIGLVWVLYKPVFFGFMFWKTHAMEKHFKIKSDPVNKQDVFICLSRPQNAKSMCQALVGLTIGSVCIYADGYLYGYRWGHKTYLKREISPRAIEKKFIVVNTGKKAFRHILIVLDGLLGRPAGRARMKCVYIISDVLRTIDPKLTPRWRELLPSRYGIKLMRWKDAQRKETVRSNTPRI